MPNPKDGTGLVRTLELTRTAPGPLEVRALELIWELNECSVSDIVRKLPQKRAYTTIMTTLARLYKKGILNRKKADRKFVYWARLSCIELEHEIVRSLIAPLLASRAISRELIISSLLEELRRQDASLFNKVVMMTRAKGTRNKKTSEAFSSFSPGESTEHESQGIDAASEDIVRCSNRGNRAYADVVSRSTDVLHRGPLPRPG